MYKNCTTFPWNYGVIIESYHNETIVEIILTPEIFMAYIFIKCTKINMLIVKSTYGLVAPAVVRGYWMEGQPCCQEDVVDVNCYFVFAEPDLAEWVSSYWSFAVSLFFISCGAVFTDAATELVVSDLCGVGGCSRVDEEIPYFITLCWPFLIINYFRSQICNFSHKLPSQPIPLIPEPCLYQFLTLNFVRRAKNQTAITFHKPSTSSILQSDENGDSSSFIDFVGFQFGVGNFYDLAEFVLWNVEKFILAF